MSSQKDQQAHIFKMQVTGDKYARNLLTQRQRVDKLNALLKAGTQQIDTLRQRRNASDTRGGGGVNAVKSCLALEAKEIAILENRLKAIKTRDSQLVADNTAFRARVDKQRLNRVMSQKIYDKHKEKLAALKADIQQTFDTSNALMAERDHMISQMQGLTSESFSKQALYDDVFVQLTDIVNKEKASAVIYRKEALEIDPLANATDFVRGYFHPNQEVEFKAKLSKLNEQIEQEQKNIAVIHTKVALYTTTLTELSSIVDVADPAMILDVFSQNEEENFRLYRYIQNISNEINQVKEDTLAIDTEYTSYAADLKEGHASTRKRMLENLDSQRKKYEAEALVSETLTTALYEKFQPLVKGVDKMFLSIGCLDIFQKRNIQVEELAAQGVTEGNILQFIAMIENRSSDIIQQYLKHLAVTDPSANSIGSHLSLASHTSPTTLSRPSSLASPTATHPLHLPDSTLVDEGGEGSDEDDSTLRPLSTTELKRRAMAQSPEPPHPNPRARSQTMTPSKKKLTMIYPAKLVKK